MINVKSKQHISMCSFIWQFIGLFVVIFIGFHFLPVFLPGTCDENKIAGIPTELYYDPVTHVEEQHLAGQWKIENPYYFNDIGITDWRQSRLTLYEDNTFELKQIPQYLFEQITKPILTDKIVDTELVIGYWQITHRQLKLYWTKKEKEPIFLFDIDIISITEHPNQLRLQYPIQESLAGGIIWCACP